MARQFRFGVQTTRARSGEDWRARARKVEDLGYSTLLIEDHFDDRLAPIAAMAAAAGATSTLRIGSLVLDNDYRHPVVLAKEVATLDLLSDGRFELGIGAGWLRADYDAANIAYDPPGLRINRLAEAICIIKEFLSGGTVNFSGDSYTVTNLTGTPKPVQDSVPILIGGGGKRLLSLAAREANIVNVNFNMSPGRISRDALVTGMADATAEKVGWIREAAGARFEEIELSCTVFVAMITDNRGTAAERLSGGFGMSPDDALESPHALLGSVDQIVDVLQERRDRFGFSYVIFPGDTFDALAPVVQKLAGK